MLIWAYTTLFWKRLSQVAPLYANANMYRSGLSNHFFEFRMRYSKQIFILLKIQRICTICDKDIKLRNYLAMLIRTNKKKKHCLAAKERWWKKKKKQQKDSSIAWNSCTDKCHIEKLYIAGDVERIHPILLQKLLLSLLKSNML